MAPSLERYLTETGDMPFVWGERDCTLWVADWWVIRHGDDPAAAFRNRYKTREEAEAFVDGDLAALIGRYVPEKAEAERGDIGVISVMGRDVAAICTGGHWAVKTEGGLLAMRAEPKAIWGK